MLLSTVNSSTTSQNVEKSNPFEEYLHHLSGQEKEEDVVTIDHCYSKLWYTHSDSHHAKPARLLFMKRLFQRSESAPDRDLVIDVEEIESTSTPPYDNSKTRESFNECEHFLKTSLSVDGEDEKESVNKSGWTTSQRNLYKQVLKVLNSDRLFKLAHTGSASELVKRRVIIDKGSRKIRQLFAANSWDTKLLSWLHRTLVENLTPSLLCEYFEIVRTLRVKVPNLMDKLLAQAGLFHSAVFGANSMEAFNNLLRKPWDPVYSTLAQSKMKKLPGNAVIVVVPSTPNHSASSYLSARIGFWNSQLSSLGKVTQLPIHMSHNIAIDECLNQIFTMAKNKVIELKSQSPKRPIILLGWTIGALIACHVALEERVNAVVCLGFPLKGVSGSRGDLDDPLLDSKIPTLFVIGQNSNTCSMDDIEDFRERMKADTGLVVVGGSDDKLRVSATKKKTDGLTQAMVDKCILDEIEEFLQPILDQQSSTASSSQQAARRAAVSIQHPEQQEQHEENVVHDDSKRLRRRPREYSPEISPIKRKARPVGRPSLKALQTSTSSETSSAYSDDSAIKRNKKKLSRRNRANAMRKRNPKITVRITPIPAVVSPVKEKDKESSKAKSIEQEDSHPKTPPVSPSPVVQSPATTKPSLAKILAEQQNSGPVDVENAFGKDSSFLPRPLTPAEMIGSEAANVADETKQKSPVPVVPVAPALSSETSIIEPDTPSITSKPDDASSKTTIVTVSVSSQCGSPEKPKKITFVNAPSSTLPLITFPTTAKSTMAIQGPQVVSQVSEPVLDNIKMPVQTLEATDVVTVGGKTIINMPQTRIVSTGGLSAKHVQGIVSSLTSKGLLTTSSGGMAKTVVVSSQPNSFGKGTTILVSNKDNPTTKKLQFRKMFFQGGSSPQLPIVSKLASALNVVVDPKSTSSEQQRVCNLSLLSDVAGMKEPIRSHDGQVTTNATLVKLTSASDAAPLRRLRVIEAIPSGSSPLHSQRFETPEELAEKQMAIRALSSSLNDETDGNYSGSSSMGYSIIMSKSNLSRRGMMRPVARRGRGRIVTGLPPPRKTRGQRFYPF